MSEHPTDRDAWLEWRSNGVTATDAAAVLGMSTRKSPYSVWASKVRNSATGLPLAPDSTEPTPAMKFGKYMEPGLALWFQDDNPGLYVIGEQTWCAHPDEPWMRATVDGFVAESPLSTIDDALGGLEIKTTMSSARDWDEHIPDDVFAQVQWQMAVTGTQRTWLATLHMAFSRELVVRVVERDEDDIAMLVAAARTLWFDHVIPGVPPTVDGSDSTLAALSWIYPGDEALDAVEADSELRIECIRINSLKTRIKEAQASLAEAENKIRAALGDHTALTNGTDAKGKPIVLATWKPSVRRSIDASALRAAEPAVAAQFTRETETRTLLVKTPKAA
jgi:putative phage-type endonuclease